MWKVHVQVFDRYFVRKYEKLARLHILICFISSVSEKLLTNSERYPEKVATYTALNMKLFM